MATEHPPKTASDCRAVIEDLTERVNEFLATVIPEDGSIPATLVSAMQYSLNAGGKRLRPILALLSYRSFGNSPADILEPACALELIHTYSLIHDDLPCMDDDDFRRGRPTLHKQYGDAIAVLAGDALHALAFQFLAETRNPRAVLEVSKAIGISGMLAGQVADVEAEGKDISREQIEYIHRNKTAALIEVALKLGAILADGDERSISMFSSYGSKIGLAFQIVDDILDVTGSQEKLGKDIGSDEKNAKATYPRVVGLQASRDIASQLIADAVSEVKVLGNESAIFEYVAEFILKRDS
ncbi:MAG: polyprenyl synthetase family protein [Candidatus Zixiibacteriota bacterium]